MTNYQILRAAVRAYPKTDLAPPALTRRNRIKYIEARAVLGERALVAGGVFSRGLTVLTSTNCRGN